MWDALVEISARERQSVHALASEIDRRRGRTAMTSAMRIFIMSYFQRRARDLERSLLADRPGLSGGPVPSEGGAGARRVIDYAFGLDEAGPGAAG